MIDQWISIDETIPVHNFFEIIIAISFDNYPIKSFVDFHVSKVLYRDDIWPQSIFEAGYLTGPDAISY